MLKRPTTDVHNCEVSGTHNSVVNDEDLLRHEAVSGRAARDAPQGPQSFETSETTHPATQHMDRQRFCLSGLYDNGLQLGLTA